MASTTAKSAFLAGVRDGLPFLIIILPFSALFGVVARSAGLDLAQTMGFSVLVIAGASQFTAVQLMTDGAPFLLVVLTALAVNLRMMMYSAALVPHLGPAPLGWRMLASYGLVDQTYALADARYARYPGDSVGEKLGYLGGAVAVIFPPWYVFSWVGAELGAQALDGWPIDVVIPITFIALFAPSLKTPAHVAAAVVSGGVALLLSGLPSGSGLLIAAMAAMATGAALERPA